MAFFVFYCPLVVLLACLPFCQSVDILSCLGVEFGFCSFSKSQTDYLVGNPPISDVDVWAACVPMYVLYYGTLCS